MDVEGYVRRNLDHGRAEADIIRELSSRICEIKPVSSGYADQFAQAVMTEVKNTRNLQGDILTCSRAEVTMGEFGVGSRGTGDFYAHRKIAEIIGKTSANVGVDEMDDAGVVQAGGQFIVCTVDGMHSRLSDFPYLAGFHVTRATLRDCYVMGAKPVMLFSDIHVADDGDVSKIFDYTAGITTVGEVMDVPLVSGSTLRIGGDMVIGDRMTGCVGCVGVADHITARREARPGDILLMTEGAGGGTIATTALYYGFPEIVDKTINLQFLKSADALLKSDLLEKIHAMTDVTNGGLRGDIFEMAETAGARFVVEEEPVLGLVEPSVRELLEGLEIDPLGVSLDALLIIAPEEVASGLCRVIEGVGVKVAEIGCVEKGASEPVLIRDGKPEEFRPRFREAAYTPLKKMVDKKSRDFEEMKAGVDRAAAAAILKKNRMIEYMKESTSIR
ncbi:MAG TPA: AIR synthase-related protein [Methanospirillum sp.]|nr:AIR synthase-related protein [Methanospirillum sp.]